MSPTHGPQPELYGEHSGRERLSLDEQSVHVWRIAADAHLANLQSLQSLLAPEEQARAARFQRDLDQARWVVGRALVRIILGGYLDTDPARLGFVYGPRGKPELTAVCNRSGLSFNVSHSGDWILCAVGRQAVGVDVEQIRPDIDALGLALRWFSEGEYRALRGLPSELQLQAFYAVWTRKEAYLKARGDGLAKGVGHFQVSVDPRAPASLLVEASSPPVPTRWFLTDLALYPGYAAALATEGQRKVTLFWAEATGSRASTAQVHREVPVFALKCAMDPYIAESGQIPGCAPVRPRPAKTLN